MLDWLAQHVLPRLTWANLLYGFVMLVVAFAVSSLLAGVVLVKMPANYFHSSYGRNFWGGRNRALRLTGFVAKNVLGAVLVLLGLVMTVAPGPGLVTILLGVTLLDFPGKRRLELSLVSRPSVLGAINGVRAKFNQPPLILD